MANKAAGCAHEGHYCPLLSSHAGGPFIAAVQARARNQLAEVHPCGRQTQRPRGCRSRHVRRPPSSGMRRISPATLVP
eukprot:scaffold40214_cov26-Tisochrysis_lutea.AAC.2